MYNVLTVLGSQIIKEKALNSDKSYINRIQVSENISLIMEDRNPHELVSNGLFIPLEGSFANPQLFHPNKTYYVVLEDIDILRDGFGHYVDYLGVYSGKMDPGIYCNFESPLYGRNADLKLINGYNGVIIGKCIRKESVLSYSGKGCPQFFYNNFLGVKNNNILHIPINHILGIPINLLNEENWKIQDTDELHIFSCRFGYQGFNWENTEYTYLNTCLYVSGVILEEDPEKFDLPTGKTHFEELDD